MHKVKKMKSKRLLALALAVSMLALFTATPVSAQPASFPDVPSSKWYHPYVMFMAGRDIVGGWGTTGKFLPDNKVIREHAAKMISLSAGLDHEGQQVSFKDNAAINPNLIPYIGALVNKGAIGGFSDNTFRPKENIKRSHACKMVAQAFGLEGGDLEVDLIDLPSSTELKKAIITLASNGIVSGFGDTGQFRPDNEISRAELSKILCVTMAVSAVQKAERAGTADAVAAAQAILNDLPYHHIPETIDALQARLDELDVDPLELYIEFCFVDDYLIEGDQRYHVWIYKKHTRMVLYDLPEGVTVEAWVGGQPYPLYIETMPWDEDLIVSDWFELDLEHPLEIEARITYRGGTSSQFYTIEQVASSEADIYLMIFQEEDGTAHGLHSNDFFTDQVDLEVTGERAFIQFEGTGGPEALAVLNGSPLDISLRSTDLFIEMWAYSFDLENLAPGPNRLDLTLAPSDGSSPREITITINRVNPANFVYSQSDMTAINQLINETGMYLDPWPGGPEPPEDWENYLEWRGENPRRIVKFYGWFMSGDADFSALTALEALYCYDEDLVSINVSNLTNLQQLSVQSNSLTTLDLDGLTSLAYLDCSYNDLLELDLSGLTSLKLLGCANNSLSALDLTGQTSLMYLYCSDNDLTNLNLNGLAWLRVLQCGYNRLNSINLNGLASLEQLNCGYNELSGLNLSGLGSLSQLECGGNLLTDLDLSGLVSLWDLGCAENFLTDLDLSVVPSLGWLYCVDNQLSSLNLSGLTRLGALYCNDNELTSLDLSDQTSLFHLTCAFNQLTSLDLHGLKDLISVDCSNNEITVIYLDPDADYWNLNVTENRLPNHAAVHGQTLPWGSYGYEFDPQK